MKKGERTRGRILDVAEKLFAQQGYEATSLRQIAEGSDIQQPGLYKYFDSKEALYNQVFERALQPLNVLLEKAAGNVGHPTGFSALTDSLTEHLAAHPDTAQLLIRSVTSPKYSDDNVARVWIGRLVEYGARINALAGLPDNKALLAVQIVSIFNTLFGYFWSAALVEQIAGTSAQSDALLAHQKDLLERFLGAF